MIEICSFHLIQLFQSSAVEPSLDFFQLCEGFLKYDKIFQINLFPVRFPEFFQLINTIIVISDSRSFGSFKSDTVVKMATPADGQSQKVEYSKAFISLCLILNIALSISIVLLNKLVYTYFFFPNMTLTLIHFIFTSIGMFVCRLLGIFTVKAMPLSKMIPISITFCGFVVLTNLSLETNTVGTYQIIKSMTTPCIIVLQTLFYAKTFSTKVKFTVVGFWYYEFLILNRETLVIMLIFTIFVKYINIAILSIFLLENYYYNCIFVVKICIF